MSTGVNKCTFIGNIAKDPEVRFSQKGTAILSINLACGRRVKKGEEWVDETDWIPCVFFGKQAEFVGKYAFKGRQVYVDGRFTTRKYEDKQGVTRYVSEIVVDKVELLGKNERSNGQSNGSRHDSGSHETAGDSYVVDAPDDSIPF